MFGITKERLMKTMQKLQALRCSYGLDYFDGKKKSWHCDCKYGVADTGELRSGEYSCGCPEFAMTALLLEHMTDHEFARICKRAEISVGTWR
jgi:hypothetical protein